MAMEIYAAHYPPGFDFPISTLFWGALIFLPGLEWRSNGYATRGSLNGIAASLPKKVRLVHPYPLLTMGGPPMTTTACSFNWCTTDHPDHVDHSWTDSVPATCRWLDDLAWSSSSGLICHGALLQHTRQEGHRIGAPLDVCLN
jgi:hypothetical protein